MIVASICHRKKLLRLSKVTRQAERTKSVMPGSARRFRLYVSAQWDNRCCHHLRLRKAKSQVKVARGGNDVAILRDFIRAAGYK